MGELKRVLLVVVILSLGLSSSLMICPRITASKGHILVEPSDSCLIGLGSLTINSTGSHVPGRWYGLIAYKCTSCEGVISSPYSGCDDCYFCTHNESINECRAVLIPIVLSLVISILVVALIFLSYKLYEMGKKLSERKRRAAEQEIENKALEEVLIKTREKIREKRLAKVEPEATTLCCALWLFLLLPILPMIKPCDVSLIVSSSGELCEDSNCEQTNSGVFPLSTGSELCFTSNKGELKRITMVGAKRYLAFEPIYKTSDFKLSVDKKLSCLGAGSCWYDICEPKSIHSDLIGFTNGSAFYDHGCFSISMPCTTCWHRRMCMFWAWKLEAIGKRPFVSRFIREYWVLDFDFRGTNSSEKISLGGHQEQSTVDGFTIQVLSSNSDRLRHPEHILTSDSGTVEVTASDLNYPEKNKIGDLQIQLNDEGKMEFDTSSISCVSASCVIACTSPASALKRVQKMEKIMLNARIVEGIVEVEERITARSLIGITTRKRLGHNIVSKASCSIRFDPLIVCLGCGSPSVLVVHGINVTDTGSAKFDSNCSFSDYRIRCQSSPQALYLIAEPSKPCEINFLGETHMIHQGVKFSSNLVKLESYVVISRPTEQDEGWGMTLPLLSNPFFHYSLPTILFILLVAFLVSKLLKC